MRRKHGRKPGGKLGRRVKRKRVGKRRKRVVVKQKSNNVVNVNRLLHEEARRHKYNVSAGAVREYSGRVVAMIEVNMPDLVALAKSHHRKTIMEDDIVVFFGLKKNGVV